MGPNGMNSFNHYAYGVVCQWIWQTCAGIAADPAQPGFKHIVMRPVPDRRLGHLQATYLSAAGLIKSSWSYKGNKWVWTFTIPEGASAFVTLPGEEAVPGTAHISFDIEEKKGEFDESYFNEVYGLTAASMATLHTHLIDNRKVKTEESEKEAAKSLTKHFEPKVMLSLEDETFLSHKFRYDQFPEHENLLVTPDRSPEEKDFAWTPDEVKAWNGCISSGRSTLVAGVVAALLTLALFAFSVLSPARLTQDLTRRYWIQQDPQSGSVLILQFGEEYADLYLYSMFGAQQVGSAPYKVTSFRTIEMGDTTIKLDIFNHTMKADPSMVTGTPTEMWYEGY